MSVANSTTAPPQAEKFQIYILILVVAIVCDFLKLTEVFYELSNNKLSKSFSFVAENISSKDRDEYISLSKYLKKKKEIDEAERQRQERIKPYIERDLVLWKDRNKHPELQKEIKEKYGKFNTFTFYKYVWGDAVEAGIRRQELPDQDLLTVLKAFLMSKKMSIAEHMPPSLQDTRYKEENAKISARYSIDEIKRIADYWGRIKGKINAPEHEI